MRAPSGFNRLSVKAYSLLLAAAVLLSVTLYLLIVKSVEESTFALESSYAEEIVRAIELDLESNGAWLKQYERTETDRRIDQLRSMISAALTIAEQHGKAAHVHGYEAEEKARAHALELIGSIQYGNNDYVWVIDTDGITLSHPNPKLVGHDVSGLKDSAGKPVIRPFLDQLQQRDEALNHYLFPRAGSKKPIEKVSYARLHKPWGWIIGTGVYLDDVQHEIDIARGALKERLRKQLGKTRFGSTGYGYIFSGDKQMIVHPDPNLEDKRLDNILNPASGKPLIDEMIGAHESDEKRFIYSWNHPDDPDNYLHEKIAWLGYSPSLDWYVATSVYPRQFSEKAYAIASRITLITGLAILVLVTLAAIAIHRGFAPLNRLAEIAREVGQGRYNHQIKVERKDEIGLLAHTFNGMLAHIRQDIEDLTDKHDHLMEEKEAVEASNRAKDALLHQIEQSKQELSHLANHDPLTGLPNRYLFQRQLEQSIATGTGLALLFIDLDRFKNINDSLGHPVGDELLCAVAERFQQRLRRGDLLARLGGDEFIVMLNHDLNRDEAEIVATALIECLKTAFTLSQHHDLFVDASIGISFYPTDGDEAHQLIKNADVAMYKAKEKGRGCYHFYSSELTSKVSRRLAMETRLRTALEKEALTLVYQPQYDLSSGHIIGVEALSRWTDDELGSVSPATFIPLAEECGLIDKIDKQAFRKAAQQVATWKEEGISGITMAVNLSALELRQGNIVNTALEILGSLELEPQQFEFEITESALMRDMEKSLATLNDLAREGFLLSIDDFGTGYSSLAYLKRFPLHKLKIDQNFVRDIPKDKDDMEIAATIIAMATQLNLQVIAEGVETEAQRSFLEEKGCQQAQGYHFSRPVSADALLKLLRDGV